MQTLEEIQHRLTQCYFSHPQRQMALLPGDILREQHDFNDRLYFVLEGSLIGTIRNEDEEDEEEQLTMFLAEPGAYIGMHSFFSNDRKASSRITAKTAAKLAWIDDATEPVEPEIYGSINEQFMRVIIDELFCRQLSLWKVTTERERVMKQLSEAERLSMLGQLAAGIAHELNNAVSVINSSSHRLSELFAELLQQYEPDLAAWFNRGRKEGQKFGSAEVRHRYRRLMAEQDMPAEQAKMLARVIGNDPLPALPENLAHALTLWDAGRDFYDMLLAGRHARDIVSSVKRLGRNDSQDYSQIDLHQTIYETLTLLQSQLRGVTVTLSLHDSPTLWGSSTELVQIWLNIIKNACDALNNASTVNPTITITSQIRKRYFHVSIANNGPPIPKELKEKIFQPHFTTKKEEHCIGLGLGLYIVQRIIGSYGGHIRLESNDEQTLFHITLPLTSAPSF
jgi:signal transduction histidine kinase